MSSYISPIRDAIRRLDAAVADHIAGPQIAPFMNHMRDHLSALARCEESNRHEARPQASENTGPQTPPPGPDAPAPRFRR